MGGHHEGIALLLYTNIISLLLALIQIHVLLLLYNSHKEIFFIE